MKNIQGIAALSSCKLVLSWQLCQHSIPGQNSSIRHTKSKLLIRNKHAQGMHRGEGMSAHRLLMSGEE